jgi:hypothetical protein
MTIHHHDDELWKTKTIITAVITAIIAAIALTILQVIITSSNLLPIVNTQHTVKAAVCFYIKTPINNSN